MTDDSRIAAILDFWFGELDAHGMPTAAKQQAWFSANASTDAAIEAEFGAAIEAALNGELDSWRTSPAGSMALLILLDQFTRNVYRGTPQAFSGDDRALALARDLVASGDHLSMPASYRTFIYLPFEHNESLAMQDQCLQLFDQLADQCDPDISDLIENSRRYAVAHREVIVRFGRFPHRNAILERESTAEELEYMETHGGF